ncbi:hypothetical protein P2H44_18320 [Albimonas sp. CAU 1670]|uniref:hypothetical protein n=1 Tax=Albimonas sp. CAU 1670 TaxID=3032599 RepID=UPI0023DBE162|nr:hypothetical protein [Albimonas sp. CAU 1670]MDF2234520.1 hypothetical protein [Albimonas sp. CAU 1670]
MRTSRRLSAATAALVLLPALAAADGGWSPPPAKDGYAYPDCYCTNRGERVEMGGTTCIRIGSVEYTAVCGMSLNNPAWRKIGDGCTPQPGASLLQRLQQLQPG